jgi:hypothetical protein
MPCQSSSARGAQGRRSRAAASAVGRAAARLASQRPPIRAAALAWLEATAARREPEALALRGPGDLGAPLRAAHAAAGSPEVRNKSTRVCDFCDLYRAVVSARRVRAGRARTRCSSPRARQPARPYEAPGSLVYYAQHQWTASRHGKHDVRRARRALLHVERAGPPRAATRARSGRRVPTVTPRTCPWQAAEWAELLARALRALAAAPGNRPAILDAGALPDLCAALAAPAAAPAAAETLALLAGDTRLAALPAPPLRALLALLGARGARAAGADGAGGSGADKASAAAAAAAARALAQLMRSAPNRCPRGALLRRAAAVAQVLTGRRTARILKRRKSQKCVLCCRLCANHVCGSTHARSQVPHLSPEHPERTANARFTLPRPVAQAGTRPAFTAGPRRRTLARLGGGAALLTAAADGGAGGAARRGAADTLAALLEDDQLKLEVGRIERGGDRARVGLCQGSN